MKRRLGAGPATRDELLEAMPEEPAQSPEDRLQALANVLTRMGLKHEIRHNGTRWELLAERA